MQKVSATRAGGPSARRADSNMRPALLARRGGAAQAELAQLAGVDRGRRTGQRIGAAGGLREGDDVADRLAAEQQRDDAVDAERDPAVRRRAEAQRLEQEPEARLRLRLVHADRREDLALDGGVVVTDRAAAE